MHVPAGTYACYSIHLKSNVALYLDEGATILAAETPHEGTSTGYDPAESNAPWEAYQDFGHNHWHNSLIWGEGLHDVAILGPGLIWGKGLSRGHDDPSLPRAEAAGVGNKAIALKNCRNVILRDFAILDGGHFAILATGVDNLTIDNLKIDTNRDGIDIDCCRNVRVSQLQRQFALGRWHLPKSSFALGYARATENVTITNCYVTGDYELGTLLDGTFKRFPDDWREPQAGNAPAASSSAPNRTAASATSPSPTASSKAAAASRSRRSTAASSRTSRSAGITMRDIRDAPLFLRLGRADARAEGHPDRHG